MQAPPVPLDEQRRLEALNASGLLDTPAEERFDRISRIAQRLFNVPMVAISLIDSSRQWIKSSIGLQLSQVSRDVSLCGHTIVGSEMVVINDTETDPRFRDNPLVTGEPHIRFYAALPLTAAEGSILGTLSIMDRKARSLGDVDRQYLRDIASIAENELRVSRLSDAQLEIVQERRASRDASRIDPLTRLWNRTAALEILEREITHAMRSASSMAVLLIDVDHLQQVNERHGHAVGDLILGEIARVLRSSLRPYDSIARYAGEEFLAILADVDPDNAAYAAERVRSAIRRELAGHPASVTVTIGAATAPPHKFEAATLLRAAENALWNGKKRGGDSIAVLHTVA